MWDIKFSELELIFLLQNTDGVGKKCECQFFTGKIVRKFLKMGELFTHFEKKKRIFFVKIQDFPQKNPVLMCLFVLTKKLQPVIEELNI